MELSRGAKGTNAGILLLLGRTARQRVAMIQGRAVRQGRKRVWVGLKSKQRGSEALVMPVSKSMPKM